MKGRALFGFAALALLTALMAQDTLTPAKREYVRFEPRAKISVRPGQPAPITFTFHIQPGYHINSHQPSMPELIPTQLHFSFPSSDIAIGKVQYPAGTLMNFPFDPSTKLSVYSGDVVIKALVAPTAKAALGSFTVHGELAYQACDNNSCYPPKKLPIEFAVDITKGTSGVPRARPTRTSPHIHN